LIDKFGCRNSIIKSQNGNLGLGLKHAAEIGNVQFEKSGLPNTHAYP